MREGRICLQFRGVVDDVVGDDYFYRIFKLTAEQVKDYDALVSDDDSLLV